MEIKVCKFGGTSLASAEQVKKAVRIVRADPTRRCVVVSAPGKQHRDDVKVTDLLYSWAREPAPCFRTGAEGSILGRYASISTGLGLDVNFRKPIMEFARSIRKLRGKTRENFIASRGEYWMAKIMAKALGYEFVDASAFIALDARGIVDIARTKKLARRIGLRKMARRRGVVIPGFYGRMPNGRIRTFSRGGSDITGSIVALVVNAVLYENWTDVDGVLMADPRVVEKPRKTRTLVYRELRELAYRGADVLHDESVFPVRIAGIPINVRNTNHPKDSGTMIVPDEQCPVREPGEILGVSGRKGLSIVRIEKALMDKEVGFLRRVCQIMERHHVNIEHVPGGIDTLSIIVGSQDFAQAEKVVLREIKAKCKPDAITVEKDVALVCIVGHAMTNAPRVDARILQAVAKAATRVRVINKCSSGMSIIVGVDEKDYGVTIRAIYSEFVG